MDRALMLNSQVQRSCDSLTSLRRSPLSQNHLLGSPHARSPSPQPRSRVNSFVASAPALCVPANIWSDVGPRSTSSAAVLTPSAALNSAPVPATAPTLGKDLRWPTNFKSEYLLGKCIGSGAFGTVHLAIHRATGQQYAVKIMSKTRAKQSRDKTLLKLQREVEQLNSLAKCEHVVKLEAKFEDDGFAYLVLEHCTGGDLDKLLEVVQHLKTCEPDAPFFDKNLSVVSNADTWKADRAGVCIGALPVSAGDMWAVTLSIGSSPGLSHYAPGTVKLACRAIAVCHSAHTMHGDIKPANFLLKSALKKGSPTAVEEAAGTGPWIKSIDYGCSQVVTGSKPLTKRAGTPVYMAPEVFRREYGVQADMWSMGMMLYHFISQRFPFWESMDECRSSTLDDVMRAVTMENIPFNFGAFLEMSPEGLDLLKGLLQRDPAKRLTAKQAINHPWFKLHAAFEEPAKENGLQVPVNISATAGVSALAASQASNALVGGASNVNSGAAQLVPHQRGILKTLV